MVPWATAPATVVFSAHPIGLKQIQQSVRVMLVLISDIKVRVNSAQSATCGICCTKLNGREHLLPFHTRFIELFMHVTSAFNGSQVAVAAIKLAAD